MPKRENYDKNSQSAREAKAKSQAITQSPERKIAQLKYRLNSIEESVTAGRQQFENAAADIERLRKQLEALEAQNG